MSVIDYIGGESYRKTRKWVFYAILVAVVVADFFAPREHAAFLWDAIPGFYALYGLVSCVLLIVVAKGVGHLWLTKKEDYYD